MEKVIFFLVVMCFAVLSCTKDKTDYEAEIDTVVTEHYEFKEAIVVHTRAFDIHIEALNGTFYKGYNEIRLKVTDAQTRENIQVTAATFLPILAKADGSKNSCPHRYDLVYREEGNYFSGYAVFTDESSQGNWQIYLSFTIDGEQYSATHGITVEKQPNKNLNMTAFTGKDDEQYFIALISPQKPKIAENDLVAGIYRYHKPTQPAGTFPDPAQFSYSEVSGYTLQLDPRMPEPSMGNHSSINNKDLIQEDDGLYHGVVNYTMTGNWTLNFILLNQKGKIVKGTEVPTDFTPGVEGAKSELYIDILF